MAEANLQENTAGTSGFGLTSAAADRIAILLEEEAVGSLFRVAVLGGGCSGFQYKFSIDQTRNEDDILLDAATSDGRKIAVAIDEMSLSFLEGAQLDFKRELVGNYFAVTNPNATASCGCGTSFAI